MGAVYTEAQARAAKKHLEKFDDIRIRVKKGKKEEYRKMSEKLGYSSMNKFIIDAIEENGRT